MNLPNKLTLFRVLLIPVIMVIAAIDKLQTPFIASMTLGNFIMLVIFLIACLTDFLDGFIARKYNLTTTFGKFADPLADKILVLALLIISLEQHSLLPGFVVTIIFAREFIVTGFRIIAAEKQVIIAAGWLGKIKTNLQMVMVVLLLIDGTFAGTWGAFQIITLVVVYLTLAMTVISGTQYIIKNVNVFKDAKEGN